MALKFDSISRIFAPMPMWGCSKGDFSFVISKDENETVYRASAKRRGSMPFDGSRYDIGAFPTLADAEKACDDYYRERNN